MRKPSRPPGTWMAIVWLVASACVAWGQVDSPDGLPAAGDRDSRGQYVISGRLAQRDSRYALLDSQGELEAYLIPRKSLDLDRFVGDSVRLTVREPILKKEGEPRLWVDQITRLESSESAPALLPFSRRGTGSSLQLAQHLEPLVTDDPAAGGVLVAESDEPKTWGPAGRVWGSAEYLLWRTDGLDLPPLVTTSPAGTLREDAGVLGLPDTHVLYGGDDVLTSTRNGLRFRAGVWFDRMYQIGLQGEYFGLESTSDSFFASSDAAGNPILARPFFNMNPRVPVTNAFDPPPREDSQLVSYPGSLSGYVGVDTETQLQSAGLALRTLLAAEGYCAAGHTWYSRVDMIAGYRYLRLTDHLAINEGLSSIESVSRSSFLIVDQFDTQNDFHGLDLGAVWQGGWKKWSLELMIKTALGDVHQTVDIQGSTTITQPNAPTASYAGGLLALPSNIGRYSRDRFAVIPELGANVGFAILPRVRATVGYTFIYWGPVARPGDQIDLDVNPDQLPPPITPLAGPLRPEFDFAQTNFWAQGITIGLEGRW